MDEKELQQNIALYYSKLPPNLQEKFSSMEWLEALKKLAVKYTLGEEQTQTLGTETTLLLLGIIHPDEYYTALDQQLGLFRDNLDKMITEINSSVVTTIRPELLEVYETNNTNSDIGEDLDKRFEILPPEVQNAIRKIDYHATLYEIATKHNLIIPQIDALEKITTNVMLGTIKGNQFESAVKENLRLPDDINKELVSEITGRILNKIRGEMINTYGEMPKNTTIPVKIIQPETTEVKQANTQVFSEHGIEIVPELLEISSPSPSQGEGSGVRSIHPGASATPEEGNKIPSILIKKFSGAVSIPSVKTEHTLPNLSASSVPTPPIANAGKPAVDPYREIPE